MIVATLFYGSMFAGVFSNHVDIASNFAGKVIIKFNPHVAFVSAPRVCPVQCFPTFIRARRGLEVTRLHDAQAARVRIFFNF